MTYYVFLCYKNNVNVTLRRNVFHPPQLQPLETLQKRGKLKGEICQIVEQCREGKILLSIPPISPLAAATMLAGIGHIANFEDAAHLKSYCGWAPKRAQTGVTFDRTSLTQGGSREMKRVMYLVAWNAIKTETEWASLYKRLVPRLCSYDERTQAYKGRGKAVGHVIGRLITLIYALRHRKMMKRSGILPLEHRRRNQCSMIENCTGTIALVTTNRSGKNCRRTGSYTFSLEGASMGEGKGPLCWSCPGGPYILLCDDCEGVRVVSVSAVCRQPAPRPLRAGYFSTEHGTSRPRGGERSGWGALVLALTPCYTDDPAQEARMERRIHEGILYQDQHKRYCLYESGAPPHRMLTCTSGCRLEVWLNRTWIAGHVEGDGEDYWFFADGGGRFLLGDFRK